MTLLKFGKLGGWRRDVLVLLVLLVLVSLVRAASALAGAVAA